MKNIKIAYKIWFSVAILVIGFLISVAQVYYSGVRTESKLENVVSYTLPVRNKIQDVFFLFESQHEKYENFVKNKDENSLFIARRESAMAREGVLSLLQLDKMESSVRIDLMALLASINEYTKQAEVYYQDENDASATGDVENIYMTLSINYVDIQLALSILIEKTTELIQSELKDIGETTRKQRNLNIQIFAVVVFLSLIIIYKIISFYIIAPISIITSVFNSVSEGDFSVKCSIDSKDEIGILAKAINSMALTLDNTAGLANNIANGDYSIHVEPKSRNDKLGLAMQIMTLKLKSITLENDNQNWISEGIAVINDTIRGETNINKFTDKVCGILAWYLEVPLISMYIVQDKKYLSLVGGYALPNEKDMQTHVVIGEGLLGQAALSQKIVTVDNIPENYIEIQSSFGSTSPRSLIIVPCSHNNELQSVIEIGTLHHFSENKMKLLGIIDGILASAVKSINEHSTTKLLLEETQGKSDTLKCQQIEMEQINKKLTTQAVELQKSEENLKESNKLLSEKTIILENQKNKINISRNELELKTEDLARANQYKTEFLANMSHELRTPLNSFLLLSKSLGENKDGNLLKSQIRDLEIIHSGGRDLLDLINDIMDLSKVEAGKLDINILDVNVNTILDDLNNLFSHFAKEKGLDFVIENNDNIPIIIQTDPQRLEQILKNFLSNAFKFTSTGKVALVVHASNHLECFSNTNLSHNNTIAFSVIDTGIGISKTKHQEIFDAFQQEDGSTSRQYGGTGLGLSISTRLAELLGGEIHLQSTQGEGSTFTVFLPTDGSSGLLPPIIQTPDVLEELITNDENVSRQRDLFFVSDDRETIYDDDNVVLIIENDLAIAEKLLHCVRSNDYKGIVEKTGLEGFTSARTILPKGILLGLGINDIDVNLLTKQLRLCTETMHIPIQIVDTTISGDRTIVSGSIGSLVNHPTEALINDVIVKFKSLDPSVVKQILIVEDDIKRKNSLNELVENKCTTIKYSKLNSSNYNTIISPEIDCIILDIAFFDDLGFGTIDQIVDSTIVLSPIIVLYSDPISDELKRKFLKYLDMFIFVNSFENLLIEISLVLHTSIANMTIKQQNIIYSLFNSMMVEGKTVLLVDDDMRNVFALSKQLRENGLTVIEADNGRSALNKIDEVEGIDLIIMDIMMPVMDGYETIPMIRKHFQYSSVPIIALTAQSMPEDRERCISAGANSYIVKPVAFEELMSVLKMYLFDNYIMQSNSIVES